MSVEKSKKNEISTLREYPIIKSNDLIQKSRYSLSLVEQKIIMRVIQMIKPEDETFKEYTFSINEFINICGINDSGQNYRKIKETVQSLREKSIWIDKGTSEVVVGWIQKAEIEKRTGLIKIKLDDDLKPFLLGIKKFFTIFDLTNILPMTSKYSIRLYELLKSYSNFEKKEYDLEKFKKDMDILNYDRWSNLKQRVLDIAVDEINSYTDLYLSYETVKKGRTITGIIFYISIKSDEFQKEIKENTQLILNKNIRELPY